MHRMGRVDPRTGGRILLCAIWAAGVAYCLYEATVYSTTSEATVAAASKWPANTGLRRATDRPTLVLTLHPQCPCSRATLEELARLLAQIATPLHVEILLYQPENYPDWNRTPLVDQARMLPGVVITPDLNGVESARFGMSVSGHTSLFERDGRLLFSGGITKARGHSGDNAGRTAIVSFLSGGQTIISRTRVFGCSILDKRSDGN